MKNQLRDCFLPPIAELDEAATLLDQAANALLKNDLDLARKLIKEADIPVIWDYVSKIIRKINPEVHHQSRQPSATLIPKNAQVKMPGIAYQRTIHIRDGWRCRYCDCRVISKAARKVLVNFFPEEARWGRTNLEKHWALGALTAFTDHVVPRSYGGKNDAINLVTACTACNAGKWHWTLEKLDLSDPRNRNPKVDAWDGLMRLVTPRLKIS